MLSGVSGSFHAGQAMPPLTFTSFTTPALTRLFVTFLKFKTSEQAIILDFLLEHFHGLFKVIIDDLDLQTTKLSQISRPFLFIAGFPGRPENPDISVSYFGKKIIYNKFFLKTTENYNKKL